MHVFSRPKKSVSYTSFKKTNARRVLFRNNFGTEIIGCGAFKEMTRGVTN